MTDSLITANAGTAQVRVTELLEPVYQPVRKSNSLDVGTACFLPVQSIILCGE